MIQICYFYIQSILMNGNKVFCTIIQKLQQNFMFEKIRELLNFLFCRICGAFAVWITSFRRLANTTYVHNKTCWKFLWNTNWFHAKVGNTSSLTASWTTTFHGIDRFLIVYLNNYGPSNMVVWLSNVIFYWEDRKFAEKK